MSEKRLSLYVEPVSLDLAWNDPKENLRRIDAAVAGRLEASDVDPAERLFLFPELTLTGFVTKDPTGLEPGPIQEIARRRRTALAAGYPEPNPQDPKRPFNVLALIAPDGAVVAKYRKLHPFTAGKPSESEIYSRGETGTACLYRGWKIGLAICFDLRFPALFHAYAKASVDLILVGSCWIAAPQKKGQYLTLSSAHAILSQAYLASTNRSGKDPFFEYEGEELVFSPFGRSLYEGRPCRLDPGLLDECRKTVVRPADLPAYRVGSAP